MLNDTDIRNFVATQNINGLLYKRTIEEIRALHWKMMEHIRQYIEEETEEDSVTRIPIIRATGYKIPRMTGPDYSEGPWRGFHRQLRRFFNIPVHMTGRVALDQATSIFLEELLQRASLFKKAEKRKVILPRDIKNAYLVCKSADQWDDYVLFYYICFCCCI